MSYWIWMCSEVSTVEGNYIWIMFAIATSGKKKKSDIMEQNL